MNHNMDTSLNLEAKALASMLSELGLSLSCAESCTGGMAAATITDGAGASRFFYGGIVAYSNTIKERILGVSADILLHHGAVSEETALDMARGAARLFGSDCAFAITGIAGPDGATADKPLGTVWFAYTVAGTSLAEHMRFSGERSDVRHAATAHALRRMSMLASLYGRR
ncbi:MAG: nicotinamide-nucleotide amidohydrolase family protein [Spirochaetia bacterium]|nr:nicotinamide-nucleotide amidohydrolase family protein [Spirochaetia bacterium]